MGQSLLVVSRQERTLYDSLAHHFADQPELPVVLDRRQAERRHRAQAPAMTPERRRAERRGAPDAGARLAAVGFAFVPGR